MFVQSPIRIQFLHLVYEVLQAASKLLPNCFVTVAEMVGARDVFPSWIVFQDV